MKKAWELELEIRQNAEPVVLEEEEQTWEEAKEVSAVADEKIKIFWNSRVPGSGAPECLMIAAVQAAGNKGLDVTKAEELLPLGLKARDENNYAELHRITSLIRHELNIADKNVDSIYWTYKQIESWDEHDELVRFPEPQQIDLDTEEMRDRFYAGWLAQICGGAFGTCLEGYTSDKLKESFGVLNDYIRKPNTFNDDITYELAFLDAFAKKGYEITANDIAQRWIALIPSGWSAEEIALINLRLGIYPPLSGERSNPYSEWIGAQMRGVIAGMVAPADPQEAARLAWADGVISHTTNGVLGEVFNALLTSMAFTYKDVKKLLVDVIELIPKESQYYKIINDTYQACKKYDHWLDAWKECEKELEIYNWIHSYPNAAAEVVAFWYGDGDFDKTMEIIGGCGQDVDCNAAQIGGVLGVLYGTDILSEKWTEPIGDKLETYVRGMEEVSIKSLGDKTLSLVKKYKR